MKKNNTAEKAILNANKITNALKEGTEKTLRDIVAEAIKCTIAEDEDIEADEVEQTDAIEDDGSNVEGVEAIEQNAETDEAPAAGEEEEQPEVTDIEGEPEDDEWSEFDDFKVGDDEFDCTGANGDIAVKVFNKLGEDDQIVIKKEDDGTFNVKDEETGAEYVIELESDEEGEDSEFEDNTEIEGDAVEDEAQPEEGEDLDDEIEFEIDSEEGDGESEPETQSDDKEDQLNEEDNLGYTDNYQDKDPIEGLKNHETAPNGAKDWNKGVPTDTKKPWAGKGEGKPFETKVNENVTTSKSQKRKEVKTMAPNSGEEDKPEVTKVTSVAGKEISENIKKIITKAKEIQAENKQYQQAIQEIKKSLLEAAALNINYGKLVNLLMNETTTKEEKAKIVERFSNVKTINEGTQLYNTIKSELNETKKSAPIIEHAMSGNSSKTINETPIYSQDNESVNLMERMDRLFKKKKSVVNESSKNLNESMDLMNRMDNLYNKY